MTSCAAVLCWRGRPATAVLVVASASEHDPIAVTNIALNTPLVNELQARDASAESCVSLIEQHLTEPQRVRGLISSQADTQGPGTKHTTSVATIDIDALRRADSHIIHV